MSTAGGERHAAAARLALASFVFAIVGVGFTVATTTAAAAQSAPRPNILWITSEDHGPQLGCYGDKYATTPNIDRLAARGITYTHVWSCAPVCAPARTTLISGLYACSLGAEHMRSMVVFPAGMPVFTQLLRGAGYYCTNNAKEDYNVTQRGPLWDQSSRQAHWNKRPAAAPFFAVFNCERSHEGQIRKRTGKTVHDPAGVRVPAYHPDTPEVRHDWAAYYDGVSEADAAAGRRLQELADAGLADETIVFYFADHGPGMPRSKRTACDSGLHVPLVVYVPAKFRDLIPADTVSGARCDRVVSFVDFAPTVLSLAGIKPPVWLQGRAFLGQFASAPAQYAFGFRGRMDERYDLVRAATDGRYVYVRNYLPHRIAGQHVAYMFETPTTQVWRRLHESGQLNAVQDAFWQPRACEELYDLDCDPDETHNLAGSPEHRDLLLRLRAAQQQWVREIRDVGFLPEGQMHARCKDTSAYDLARDEATYPLERVFAAAELASRVESDDLDRVLALLDDADSAVRYWGAVGVLIRGGSAVETARERLLTLADPPMDSQEAPSVRIAAEEVLWRYGNEADRQLATRVLVELADWSKQDVFTVMAALGAFDPWEPVDRALGERLAELPKRGPLPHQRYASYVPRLLETLLPRPTR
ncbi:MAG: sulfatase [Pirellulales bacterium]|nr:sulfatase [Pirellulales bacterium]